MSVSSMGMGSGMDIRSLVDQLAAAERAPAENRLDRRERQTQEELSGYGTLKSALSDFRGQLGELRDIESFGQTKASSSNEEALGVSASSKAGGESYQVSVDALAAAQSLASGAFADRHAVVGGGKLTFRFGEVEVTDDEISGFKLNADRPTQTIDIPEGATLVQLRDAIHDAKIGVEVSIINDGSGERLLFNSKESGAGNGFTIDVERGSEAGLEQLAFNAGVSNLTRTRAGEDAQVTINGLAVKRPTNQIDDAIEGMTLELKQVTGDAVQVGSSRDIKAAEAQIRQFVEGFNNLQQTITKLTRYDPETEEASVFTGNAMVRGINSQLRNLLTNPVSVLEGNAIRSVADLGIVTERDGTLGVDGARLTRALEENFDQVGALFASSALTDQANGVDFAGSSAATQAGRYQVQVDEVPGQGRYTGGSMTRAHASSPIVIGGRHDRFQISVDGVDSGEIKLSRGTYATPAELAAEMQARINGDSALRRAEAQVSVHFDRATRRFEITSARYGAESDVRITAALPGVAQDLGLAVREGRPGNDIAGRINGQPVEGVGRQLQVRSGAGEGLRLDIAGNSTGDRGRVIYSRGILEDIDSMLDSYLSSDGLIDGTTQSLTGRMREIERGRETLDRRMEGVEKRLREQFTAMDVMVGQLNETGQYLDQQLKSLPGVQKKK